jgi:hypothetical protein
MVSSLVKPDPPSLHTEPAVLESASWSEFMVYGSKALCLHGAWEILLMVSAARPTASPI